MLRRIIEVFLVRYLYTVYTDKDDMPQHSKKCFLYLNTIYIYIYI